MSEMLGWISIAVDVSWFSVLRSGIVLVLSSMCALQTGSADVQVDLLGGMMCNVGYESASLAKAWIMLPAQHIQIHLEGCQYHLEGSKDIFQASQLSQTYWGRHSKDAVHEKAIAQSWPAMHARQMPRGESPRPQSHIVQFLRGRCSHASCLDEVAHLALCHRHAAGSHLWLALSCVMIVLLFVDLSQLYFLGGRCAQLFMLLL